MKINATIKIIRPNAPDCAAVSAALESIVREAAGFEPEHQGWDELVGQKLRAGVSVPLAFTAEQFARFILLRRQADGGTDVLKAGDTYKRLRWEPIGEGVEP